jgi:quercetin dioxygenase-like cupin family protein
VLKGAIEYLLEDEWVAATAGSCVFVPAGVIHSFRTIGDAPARHLAIVSPSEGLGLVEGMGQMPPEDWAALFKRFDSELV